MKYKVIKNFQVIGIEKPRFYEIGEILEKIGSSEGKIKLKDSKDFVIVLRAIKCHEFLKRIK